MRRALLALALASWLSLPAAAAVDDDVRTILHLLDYIAADYPGAVEGGKVRNAGEYGEMREFSSQVSALAKRLPPPPPRGELDAATARLSAAIEARADAAQVASLARGLSDALIAAHRVEVTPRKPPDLARGGALFAEQCAGCHGAFGAGDGPLAKGMQPPPADLRDAARMGKRSPFAVFNTITLGVSGTAMAPFRALPENDRWALAYHVARFTQPMLGSEARPAPLDFAAQTLARSVAAYRGSDRDAALTLAIRAYLEGYELVERSLDAVDGDLAHRAESAFMAVRHAIESNAGIEEVEAREREAQALLGAAKARLAQGEMSAPATFSASLLILVREGVEAVLVLAAIFAFLGRAGREDARRYVHAGWIAALLLGLLTWFVSERLLAMSGATREATEGITALVSAGMLLYVGYWLHDKTHATAWNEYLKARLGAAVTTGSLRNLGFISFLAVYREIFETVLFYEALATQAGPGGHGALVAGVVTGAAVLAALTWALLRWSRRIPLGPFFKGSAALLAALAIVFAGQGVAALQEAGWIGSHAFGGVRLPMLGIFPTLQTLGAQLAVAAAIAAGLLLARRAAPPSSAE